MTLSERLQLNYPQLQNLIKRDAVSYREEFLQQYEHFKTRLSQQGHSGESLETMLVFMSHVAGHYPESRLEYPKLLVELAVSPLTEAGLRRTVVQCLLLARKNKMLTVEAALETLFKMLLEGGQTGGDKALREQLYQSIVGEISRANRPQKANSLNQRLQNYLYKLLGRLSPEAGKEGEVEEEQGQALLKCLEIVIELFRKGVWQDSHTVNLLAEAAMKRPTGRILRCVLHFFLGRFRGKSLRKSPAGDGESEEENEEEEKGKGTDYKGMLHRSHLNGSRRSDQKRLKKALNKVKRQRRKANGIEEEEQQFEVKEDKETNFAPIQLLNDPQGFVERLYTLLRKCTDGFEVKLLLLNVISRLVGSHRLLLVELYPFLLRYIQPQQRHVTKILACAAQAAHPLVPAEYLSPLLRAIADNFVAEHCASEVIAAGLNGLRAICQRAPLSIDADLLQDLVGRFKGGHGQKYDKGVTMAARSLIGLYRDVDPSLLHKRDRGKEASMALRKGKLTKPMAMTDNTGAVHFDFYKALQHTENAKDEEEGKEEEDGEGSWEEASEEENIEASDDEEGWEEVSEAEELSEAEQVVEAEKEKKPQQKTAMAKPAIDIIKLASERILSGAESALLRKRLHSLNPQQAGEEEEEEESSSEDGGEGEDPSVVDPASLQSSKRKKHDYQARMQSIKNGRLDRPKFGSKRGRHTAGGAKSTSNRIKAKRNKNAIMQVHKRSVRAKKFQNKK